MSLWSLKNKLLLSVLVILTTAQLLVVLVGTESMRRTESYIVDTLSVSQSNSLSSYLEFAAVDSARQVSDYLNRSFDLPLSVSSILSSTALGADVEPLNR